MTQPPRRVITAKERNIARDYDRGLAQMNTAAMLKGHSCAVCGALGEHLEDHCPSRTFVGLPEVLRKQKQAETLEAAYGTYGPHEFPPWYIDGAVMVPILRTRPDVPPSLRCYVCASLATAPVWCQICDTLSCSECLAPPDAQWVCNKCGNCKENKFHVVTALRELVQEWVRSVTMLHDAHASAGAAASAHSLRRPPL